MVAAVGTTAASLLLEYAQQAFQSTSISALTSSSSSTSSIGGTPITGGNQASDSSSISGPGQLLGDLQQLLTQSTSTFQSVTSSIANELQAASQQTTGNESQFLSSLSSSFLQASTSGSLTSLLTHHHHQTNSGQGVYNQQGQVTSTGLSSSAASIGPSSGSTGANLQQLFTNITNQVQAALIV